MNIVILTASLSSAGGTERTIAGLTSWLAKNTKDNISIVKLDKRKSFYEINPKVKIIEPPKEFSHGKIRGSRQRLAFCKSTFKNLQPAIILTFYAKTTLYAHFTQTPHCQLVGSERYNPLKRNLSNQILAKIASLYCDKFIFQTRGAQKCYPKSTIKKSIVIPNAINSTPPKDPPSRNKTISAVGRLTKQKGFDILISAFENVHKKHSNWKLEIFGIGEDEVKLNQQISNAKLKNSVTLMGNKNNLSKYINHSTIFVLSSRDEGMPNALMEAMSCGLACISTDCNFGPSDLIKNNSNGILVPVEDADALFEAITFLIENPAIRAKLGAAAKNINSTHSPDIIYQKYYQYIAKKEHSEC